MTNADILTGAIAVLSYVFIVCPCLVGCIASDAKYLDAVKGGVIFTLFCVVFVGVASALFVAVMYFTGDLRPDTPVAQLIDWVNAL